MTDLDPKTGASQHSLMFTEAASAGHLLPFQRIENAAELARLKADLAARPVRTILTLARGSSDNAATFARYLIERRLGLVTSSMAPSINAIYCANLDLGGSLVLAISQSGRSPDLVGSMRRAKQQGARVVAIVNDSSSPLALEADYKLSIGAGPELSVAATKTFTLSLTAVIDLIAELASDVRLKHELESLPADLHEAWELDWSDALEPLEQARNLYVVARGHALGIAQEMALKFKETCCIHAEAFSAAEVQHGPMALVEKGFPVILLGQDDEAREDIARLAGDFESRGACVIHSGLAVDGGLALPSLDAEPLISPLLQLQSFYRFCEALSRRKGLNPDCPRYLNKVTRTL